MKLAVILTALALSALGAVYVWRSSYGNHDPERFEGDQWRLRQLDATFNEDLLRARFSLLENYDDFERYLAEMERLAADLRITPRFVSVLGRDTIVEEAAKFAQLLRERRELLERFKSRNAVLGNSRRYFPIAVGQLFSSLGDTPSDRELAHLAQDLTAGLLASASSADDPRPAALAALDRLRAWVRTHPASPALPQVTSLIRHAQQLLTGKIELNGLTRQLLGLPTADSLQRISAQYERELAVALHRSQQYRWFLVALGGMLFAAVAYAMSAQGLANRRLEARVSARTFELSAEVEERKRTASALEVSEGFFHSLVEHLPVCVFRKDPAGRFTFANKLFCDHVGVGPDQILGRTAFDTLPPADAVSQRKIEENIMASGRAFEANDVKLTVGGKPCYVDLTKVPVFDAAGQCVGVQGMYINVTQRLAAERELDRLNRRLIETSRQAGMAEVASGVLHNIGNVLNSVNVSATLVMDQIRGSKIGNLPKLGAMLRDHASDLAHYLTADPKGRRIPAYLISVSEALVEERTMMTEELGQLRKNIEHIRDIVAMQQNYAKVSGVVETVAIAELVEDALRMNADALDRGGFEVVTELEPELPVTVERHKVLQILVNLIRNAKHACESSSSSIKRVTLRAIREGARVRVSVADDGIGIPPENLTRIFAHGFTTKKDGHGFGLHSGALAAKELGGSLAVMSGGVGQGATFTLELPVG